MKKLLLLASIISFLTFNISFAYAEPETTVSSVPPILNEGTYILIDSASGEVLCEKDSEKTGMYPASTTKIMTAALALENGNTDQMMTASKAAVNDIGRDGMNIGIMPGEQMPMYELLKALMISSANETANIIAENISPSRQEFVDRMNKKATELGALNTHFVNPCGAQNDDHYTTAADLSKIARYAMTFDVFREIVKTKNFQLLPTNKHTSWPVLVTTNKLMQYDKGTQYSITGIKTGYTGPAGYCLVTSASDETGLEFISVVMGMKSYGSQTGISTFTRELMDYGFNNYEKVTLIEKGQAYRSVSVADAVDETPLDLLSSNEITSIMLKNASVRNVEENVKIFDNISAPINEGDILGYVEYTKDGKSVGKSELLASRSVEIKKQAIIEANFKSFSANPLLKKALVIFVSVILFFVLLRIILRTISRRLKARKF